MSIVPTRSENELQLMRKSGEITARALKKVLVNAKPGVSLADLDRMAEEEIISLGGQSSFKTVPGYFWTTCLTVNEEVVHGTPRPIVLKEGDILGVDLGAVYQGWHTDSAWSVLVGDQELAEKQRFLQIGEEAMWSGINKAVVGKRVGDISAAIQKVIEGAGYSVVKTLTGHGVGKSPHEEPMIPGFGKPGTGMKLKQGMTLAIEAIYTERAGNLIEKEDGWTLASKNGSLGGLCEMTVIVGSKKPEVLTDWRKY